MTMAMPGWQQLPGPWQPARHDDVFEPVSWLPLPARGHPTCRWPYHCFSLSLRDVRLILGARGIVVSYQSIRDWSPRFGRIFANMLKRRPPQPGGKW
jgi:hypothetical protein